MKNLSTRSVIFLIISLLSIKMTAQPDLSAARTERNVVFGMYSGLALLMDVYYPEKPNGYGVIQISGSGWNKPLSYEAPPLNHQGHVKIEGEALVAAGYTLFSINHRATPRFAYPAAVEDVQRAVRFIRYHAGRYKIDPDRIGAVGGSSGGHLVSMLGVLNGDEFPSDDSPLNKMSAKVQCVIARAAPSDLTGGGLGELFLGVRGSELNDHASIEYKRAMEASPVFHITADDPPFLLVHGDKDDIVPISLSEKMLEKFKTTGVTARLVSIEGAGHGPGFPGATTPPDLKKLYVEWMDKHLKK
ncbi:MAG: alpha/beta hydrolase [Cyclobacteriaceae bacterium]|nr:alpha/beta hydrolase [Cyclobacteriaceae bacterium]